MEQRERDRLSACLTRLYRYVQNPTLTVSPASSLESGRYRSDTAPIAVYSGQMRVPAGAVPIGIELHAGGQASLGPKAFGCWCWRTPRHPPMRWKS